MALGIAGPTLAPEVHAVRLLRDIHRPLVRIALACLLALGLFQPLLSAQKARAGTHTVLSVSAATVVEGDTLKLTAVVSSPVVGRLNGDVEFFDFNRRLRRAPLIQTDQQPQAVLQVSSLMPGMHSLTARYLGNDDYSGSASPIVMVVVLKR